MQSPQARRLAAKILSLAIALYVAAPTAGAALHRPPAGRQNEQQQRRPLPPRQYMPARDYDTRHIKLDLRFDWERERAIGTESFTFAPLTRGLRAIELDAANMTFASVKLASGAPLRYEADGARQKLRVMLDRAYQPSEAVTIIISYSTNGVSKEDGLTGFGQGLTFIKPTPDDPNRPRQIWSQGETTYNHHWFPCFDSPNDFATTEISATVEKPLSVVSNGRLLETRTNADGTRTFHWKMEQPHASYLTSIVVGEYAPVEGSYMGIPVITYVYPKELEEGRVTAARLPEMVKFFSEKTGVKYPYAKYAQVVTRDFGGGMENITATTQTDGMIHDRRTTLDRDFDGLQSHELAHQWFGDYVTCRAWSDIWLNESFATYFQALWDEHRLGQDDFLYRDVKANQDAYFGSWKQGYRRPIVTSNYADKDGLFDNYAYPRGAAVLHMLRKTVGEENWWRAINHYLKKYAHQPVQTEQLRVAFEEATGQPLDWFFDQWLYRMGHPVFSVSQSYDAGTGTLTLKVRQEQKPDPTSSYPQAEFFRAPLEVEIATESGTRVERVEVLPVEEQSFSFKIGSRPILVNFDYHGTVIKELKFEKSTDELVYQLNRDQDVVGRLWALGQLSARAGGKGTSDDERRKITLAMATALAGDGFWGVRSETAAALGNIQHGEGRTALIAAAGERDARVRAAAVSALAKSKDPALASIYTRLLGDQSYATVNAAALALGETKSPGAYEALVKLLDAPSWHDQLRAYALAGLANLGDKRAFELGVRYSAGGNWQQVRAAALRLLGTVGRDDPRAYELVSQALLGAAPRLNFQLAAAAGEALVRLSDPRGVELLEKTIKGLKSQQFQGFLKQYQQRLQEAVGKK